MPGDMICYQWSCFLAERVRILRTLIRDGSIGDIVSIVLHDIKGKRDGHGASTKT